MLYVLTSNLNAWDNLRPPAEESQWRAAAVRWICFTNNPLQSPVPPWEFRPIYDVGQACRTARVPKILPHLMLPDDCEISIWHDANFQLKLPPVDIIRHALARHDWAAHVHPGRRCIYEEGNQCIKESIGTPALIRAELNRYNDAKYPPQSGLWANGFLVRRHTPKVKLLCDQWWRYYAEGGERDQISFPFVRRMIGVEVNTINASPWESPYAVFNFHAAWITRTGNDGYLPERARMGEKLARLAELTGVDGGIQWPEK